MPKGIAINIGLNAFDPSHYGSNGALKNPENDARAMHQIAVNQGYASKLFLTKDATSSKILGEVRAASSQLNAGDTLLVTYAGHGATVVDPTGEEPDGRDETWCLFDRMVLDDELFQCWKDFAKGVNILIVSDSCHSGTVARVVALKQELLTSKPAIPFRCLPTPEADFVYAKHQLLYESLQFSTAKSRSSDPQASILLLAACQDDQLSSDGAGSNGLYTEKILSVWNGGRFAEGHANFFKAIKAKMPSTQVPNFFWAANQDIIFESAVPFTIDSGRSLQLPVLNGHKFKWELEIDSRILKDMPIDFIKYKLEQDVPTLLLDSYKKFIATQETVILPRGGEIEIGCKMSDKGWECGAKGSIRF